MVHRLKTYCRISRIAGNSHVAGADGIPSSKVSERHFKWNATGNGVKVFEMVLHAFAVPYIFSIPVSFSKKLICSFETLVTRSVFALLEKLCEEKRFNVAVIFGCGGGSVGLGGRGCVVSFLIAR